MDPSMNEPPTVQPAGDQNGAQVLGEEIPPPFWRFRPEGRGADGGLSSVIEFLNGKL